MLLCKVNQHLYRELINCLYFSVAVPVPFITANESGTLYAGRALTLTCDYPDLTDSVDTDTQMNIIWIIDASDNAMNGTDKSSVTISPLRTSNTGTYTCILMVTAPQSHVELQKPTVQRAELDIIVQSKI